MPRSWLLRSPVLIGMALLLLPWAFAAGNAALGWLTPGGHLWTSPTLNGVQAAPRVPALTAASLWQGDFQRAAAARFALALPLLPEAVQLKSQVYMSALQQSPTPSVLLGQHGWLYEDGYVYEYCHRSIAGQAARAEAWAGALAELQHWYAVRGRLFLYVITPSKAATYPNNLPRDFDCPAPQADRDGAFPAWRAMLQRHGVATVDAAALVASAAPDYPVPLFPRGGTHWGAVASALATQALVGAINAAGTPFRLPPFTFTWHPVPPVWVDRDITDLLNLPWPPLDYSATEISIAAAAPADCRKLQIGIVGGSFVYQLAWTLMKLPCPPQIDFYAYFTVYHAYFPGDLRSPVLPAQRDPVLLRSADIVLLEENEQFAMHSQHGLAFYRLMTGHDVPQ